jgi:hypothetical protein
MQAFRLQGIVETQRVLVELKIFESAWDNARQPRPNKH